MARMNAGNMDLTTPFIILTIATAVYLLGLVIGVKRTDNEPPYISPKIPIIGHAIGLLQRKYDYYVTLSKKYKLPIYGLAMPGMPGGRVYVINSPSLILALQKVPKKLSFWHVEATFTVGMAGLHGHAAKALTQNINGEEDIGGPSLFGEGMTKLHAGLKPGEVLQSITRDGVNRLASSIDKLGGQSDTVIELSQWITEEVMASITDSIYGPKNPFKDPAISKAFVDFEDNAVGLISFPLPSITCAKAYKARESIVASFEKFYKEDGPATASPIIRNGSKISDSHGLSINDKSRIETCNGHAILANTIPTAIWTIYHVLSDEKVLQEVRSAVMPLVTEHELNGTMNRKINISQIRDIPIMKSVLHEALRHYGCGTGTRIVLEDTLLDNQYLLKKDSFVFMPNRSYHFSEEAWGPNVNEFQADRFIKSSGRPGAFRGFGGGINLCPGRFYAMNEILALCSMLALRYDFKPVGGKWTHPGVDESNLSLIVSPPKDKVLLQVIPRANSISGVWEFTL